MKKTVSTISNFLARHWSFLAFTALAIGIMMEPAFAGGGAGGSNLNSVVDQVGKQAVDIPKLLSLGAYTVGTGTIMAGGFKLKSHADNPGQTPISHGLARVLIGGTLMAVPSVGKIVLNTAGTDASQGVQFVKPTVAW